MHFVFVDFRRTQATLFAVDRLRVMVGSNAMLARLLQCEFPAIVARHRPVDLLAGRTAFDGISEKHFEHDDPRLLLRNGVLAAAGGRLIAVVSEQRDAEAVREAVFECAALLMPRLAMSVRVGAVPADGTLMDAIGNAHPAESASAPLLPFDSPYFERDRNDGRDPALAIEVREREKLGYSGTWLHAEATSASNPLLSFLDSLRAGLSPPWDGLPPPQDFHDVVGDKERAYLAAIDVDGNSFGKAFDQFRTGGSGSVLDREVRNEWFWWSLRGAMRTALGDALRLALAPSQQPGLCLPFQVLWRGGDDLFVAIDARFAFDFVQHLCARFEALTESIGRGVGRLTLSVGIAVVPPALPFSRVRLLAAELLDSAKLLRATRSEEEGSAVDWHVVKTSDVSSLAEQRRREYVIGDGERRFILTRRPHPVLDSGTSGGPRRSLQTMLQEVRRMLDDEKTHIDRSKHGRNRRKRMRVYLRDHPQIAMWMYEALFDEKERERLGGTDLFAPVEGGPGVSWTEFLDCAEIEEFIGGRRQ